MKNQVIRTRTNAMNIYLNEIRGKQYEPMTAEEEVEVFAMLHNGDDNARERILKANQRFAFSEAKKYSKGDNIMDLVEEATIGMNTAIDKFDSTRGFKFFTFAVHYIHQAFSMYYYRNAPVRQSNSLKLGNSVAKIVDRFLQENQREPSVEEIKIILKETKGIDVKNDSDIDLISFTSVDGFIGDDDDRTFENSSVFNERTSCNNEIEANDEQEAMSDQVRKLMSMLDERSRKIIKMLFGIGCECAYCVEDIAEEFDLTPTRVLQIRNAALKKMRG